MLRRHMYLHGPQGAIYNSEEMETIEVFIVNKWIRHIKI